MSLWRQFNRGIRALTRRATVAVEVDDEVRDYFERARQDLIDQGMPADEASRVARRRHGDPARAREDLRDYGWENTVAATFSDLRYSLRRLQHSPGFTLIAVLTLALGIGASAAIFSAVVPILIEPLPYPDSNRIVQIVDRDGNGAPLDVTYGTYLEVAARSRSFDELAIADRWQPSLVGVNEPERLSGDFVSATYFGVLGIAPALGRDFMTTDDVPGNARVAIVTDGLAKRRFGSAAAVLNETIRLDDADYEIIGVLPERFENVLAPAAEVWSPRRFRAQAPFDSSEWGHHQRMIGRLAPGVTIEQARKELATIGGAQIEEFPRPPWALFPNGLTVESLQRSVTAGARPVLLAIMSAVLLLLVIACANVTNLLLARSVRRQSELAVRAALGAGRGRLVRQLLTESLLLAVLGGAFALPVALVGIDGIVALAPAGLARLDAVRLDVPAFAIALGITTVAGIAVGLVPALRSTRPGLRAGLQTGARVSQGSHNTVRSGLVVTEVALALMLLVGAGLLYRSVAELLSTPPGFDASGLVTLQIVSTDGQRAPRQEMQSYFESIADSVRALPGVTEAALTSQLPLGGEFEAYGVRFENSTDEFRGDTDSALRYTVTPDWFRAMEIPLVEGRLLDVRDRPDAPNVVLLSESFAKRRFPGRSTIGERVRIGPGIGEPDRPWEIVVGVVGDVKQASLELAAPDAFYVAMGQWAWVDAVQSIVVRTDGDPAALVPSIRQTVWSVDPTTVIARVETMEGLLTASEAARRFTLTVFAIFAAAALALSALGLYGVMAGSVEERTREIGLRSALGATPASIISLVVARGLRLAALGVAIGVVGAIATTRGLTSMLFNVTPADPVTYVSVIAAITAIAASACWLPALRASRVDPTIALRSE